jgi:hypothetical protein
MCAPGHILLCLCVARMMSLSLSDLRCRKDGVAATQVMRRRPRCPTFQKCALQNHQSHEPADAAARVAATVLRLYAIAPMPASANTTAAHAAAAITTVAEPLEPSARDGAGASPAKSGLSKPPGPDLRAPPLSRVAPLSP